MDITDGYDGLDFVLSDPGLIEDTRIADAAVDAHIDSDAPLHRALQAFDRSRSVSDPAAMCLIRFRSASSVSDSDATAKRILSRIQGAIRSPDFCTQSDRGDYAIGLAGCDVETARKRVALMTRLVQLDPAFETGTSVWIGMTPVAGDSAQGMRTALLACDLAAFQPSGHVEVIEL